VIYSLPRAKPDIIYIGLNDRDPRWHDLYELHLSTGEKTLLRKNTERIANWVFDHDATLRLAVRLTEAETRSLARRSGRIQGDLQLRCAGRLWPGGFRRAEQAGLPGNQQGAAESHGIGCVDPATGARRRSKAIRKSMSTSEASSFPSLTIAFFSQIRGRRRSAVLPDHAFEAQLRWLSPSFQARKCAWLANDGREL